MAVALLLRISYIIAVGGKVPKELYLFSEGPATKQQQDLVFVNKVASYKTSGGSGSTIGAADLFFGTIGCDFTPSGAHGYKFCRPGCVLVWVT